LDKTRTIQFLKEHKKLLYAALVVVFLMLFFFLDKTTIRWIRNFQESNSHSDIYLWLESIDPFIGFISHGTTLIIIASLLYAVGRLLKKRVYLLGKFLLVGFLSSGIAVQFLKHFIGRARPRLTDELMVIGPSVKFGYDSFPSGHTAVIFCLTYIFSQYLPRYRLFFYSLALIVGFERIEDLSHFPSDVLAGAILGLIIGKLLLFKMAPSPFLSPEHDGNSPKTAKENYLLIKEKAGFLDRYRVPIAFAFFSIFIIEDFFEITQPHSPIAFWGSIGLLIVLCGALLRPWAAGVIRRKGFLAVMKEKALFFDRYRIPIAFAFFSIFIIHEIFEGTRPHSLIAFWGSIGLLIVLCGVFLRSWAAGIVRKRDSLKADGSCFFTRHPALYIGSFLIVLGFCIILNDIEDIFLVLIMIPVICFPKMRQQESEPAQKLNGKWDRYVKNTFFFFLEKLPLNRRSRWSLKQWIYHREYQAFATSLSALILMESYGQLLLS
jgi:membrane-associated phospholipid phosphatase/protein-S-isoprenylcysteine O-methyltransferase Ste14